VPRIAFLPAGLVAVAGLCDAAGAHGGAFWLLVLSVPFAALAALLVLGAALDTQGSGRLTHSWLQGAALLLILFGAAARAPFRAEGSVPEVALSALVVCLLVYGTETALLLGPAVRARIVRALESDRRSRLRRRPLHVSAGLAPLRGAVDPRRLEGQRARDGVLG
jgi:hypothetical protein